MSESEVPLVPVAAYSTPVEAQLARNLLDEQGIPAFLADAEAVVAFGLLGPAVGSVKLLVAEADLPEARRILERQEKARRPEHDDYGLEPRRSRAERPEAEETDEEVMETPRDAWARRAFLAAIIGLLVCPPVPHFYSLYALTQISSAPGELSPVGQRARIAALIIDILVFAVIGLFLLSLAAAPPAGAPKPRF